MLIGPGPGKRALAKPSLNAWRLWSGKLKQMQLLPRAVPLQLAKQTVQPRPQAAKIDIQLRQDLSGQQRQMRLLKPYPAPSRKMRMGLEAWGMAPLVRHPQVTQAIARLGEVIQG